MEMPDRPSSGVRSVLFALLALVASTSQLHAQQAPGAKLTITSDVNTAVVDSRDDKQVAQSVRQVIASQVKGVDVIVDSLGAKLRIAPALSGIAPLFVIDGIPLADGYALTILTKSLERIDLFRDSATTSQYGPRGTKGVVLIATSRH
jgi:hypothetical protein